MSKNVHLEGKVSGVVEVVPIPGGRVYVRAGENGQAHLNDDRPAIEYRGEQWIGGVWFEQVDGEWVEYLGNGFAPSFSSRQKWDRDAPKSFRAAIVAALAAVIPGNVDGADLVAAQHAANEMAVNEAKAALDEAQAAYRAVVAEAQAKLSALVQQVL